MISQDADWNVNIWCQFVSQAMIIIVGYLDVQASQRLREIPKYKCDIMWDLSDVKQVIGKADKMFSKLTHLLRQYCYCGDVYITTFIKKWEQN